MMLKSSISKVVLCTLCSFFYLACGGAQPSSGPNENNESVSAGADSPADGSTKAPTDKYAEQAKKYCEHEAAKAENQPPDTLSRKQIQACLTGIRGDISQNCSSGVEKEIVLKLIIEKNGVVTGAFPVGDSADSPEADCVSEKVKGVKFPRFIGKSQQVIEKYPFKLGAGKKK